MVKTNKIGVERSGGQRGEEMRIKRWIKSRKEEAEKRDEK